MRRNGLWVFGVAALPAAMLAMTACGGDTTSGSGGSGGAGSSGTSMSTSTGGGMGGMSTTTGGGMGGMAAGTGGMGGAGGTGGSAPVYGTCKKGCMAPADCCPPNQPTCPSNQYPYNPTCESGVCVPPQCSVKADCTFGGQLPQNDCLLLSGLKSCVRPCTKDTDCTGQAKCAGVADDMTKYCQLVQTPTPCMGDTDCGGAGKCVNGDCVCENNMDCTAMNANVCAK